MMSLICQILNILVSLDVDDLSPSQRLRGAHITLEEFIAWPPVWLVLLDLPGLFLDFPVLPNKLSG
jgi:hypothetical protein